MNEHLKGFLLTSLGVLAIVPDSILIRLIDAPDLAVVFWRAAFTTLTLFIGLAIYYRGRLPARLRSMGWRGLAYGILSSGGISCFVLAVQYTTIASAVMIVATTPIFAALISRIFLGEPLTPRKLGTIAVCVGGVAIITGGGDFTGDMLGELFALCTAIALASALTIARAARHMSMVPSAALGYLIASLITLPFAAPGEMDATDFGYALLLGCVFIPFGVSLLTLGPRYISSAEVSLLLLLEATLAPILAWYVLDEVPGQSTLVGGAIILTALLASNLWAVAKSQRNGRKTARA
ncbi:DMT family transporter [Tepidamorphus sp. 3E244]|uniref:DMT family transporter n=1 Tax=Tepidamorphus sp. 3E244 TaxID=3385498 RepID=UPI0038FC2DC6